MEGKCGREWVPLHITSVIYKFSIKNIAVNCYDLQWPICDEGKGSYQWFKHPFVIYMICNIYNVNFI